MIATQTRYELTRDNCHRFVRVFTTLVLCPNHPADTLPILPFDVEEYIATRGLSQTDGCGGKPPGNYRFFGLTIPCREDYEYRASRLVGQGAEWTLNRESFGRELSLTIRRLEQKSTSDDNTTTYYDEFRVIQEQTLYRMFHFLSNI